MTPDERSEYGRRYYQRNRDAIREYHRRYYERNFEAIAAAKRAATWDPAQSELAAADPAMTCDEIAAALGLTKARVSQILCSALRKLRRDHPRLAELLR